MSPCVLMLSIFSFNTQPHGGGCHQNLIRSLTIRKFQHTAARRRLHGYGNFKSCWNIVSTHSRTEAAAAKNGVLLVCVLVSTHSRTEAAADVSGSSEYHISGFNTQPHGGGCSLHKKVRKISELNTVFR